jgi:hypothetical protein
MSENRAAPFTESKKSQKETALISDTKPFYGWWIVAAGTAVLFVSSGIDQFPDGEPPQASSSDQPASVLIYSAQMRRWTRSEAIRTVPFWFIVIAFLLALTGQIAFLVHQVSFLSH